jgi:hypothetical protein
VDEVSREETTAFKDRIASALKLSPGDFEAKLECLNEEGEQTKRTFRRRAEQVVSELQVRELNETIQALDDLLAEHKYTYMVLIDDLDDNWTSEHTQYLLIRGLIASLKTFKRIENLKIPVAIREDLYEATLRAATDRHFQPEKLNGMIVRIRWSAEQLHRLVERRLNHLFMQHYTRQGVGIEDVLPVKMRTETIRAYLVARTLCRPRDIIAFVNRILNVGGQGLDLPISSHVVAQAEIAYARDRLEALEREWHSCHPLIRTYLDTLAKAPNTLTLLDFDERRLYTLLIAAAGVPPEDNVVRIAHTVYERNKEQRIERVAAELVACLFKIGAIGVKARAEEPYRYCYEETATLDPRELNEHSKISIHPMLKPVLGSHDKRNKQAA